MSTEDALFHAQSTTSLYDQEGNPKRYIATLSEADPVYKPLPPANTAAGNNAKDVAPEIVVQVRKRLGDARAIEYDVGLLQTAAQVEQLAHAAELAPTFGLLVDKLVDALPWLMATLREAADSDPFTKRLMKLCERVQREGESQKARPSYSHEYLGEVATPRCSSSSSRASATPSTRSCSASSCGPPTASA